MYTKGKIAVVIAAVAISGAGTVTYLQQAANSRAAKPESQTHKQEGTANRLAESFSPYLRQHMYNPVDWHRWGETAFEKARQQDKPIFLSVGYSTCYWCHVMERKVFSDAGVATAMNEAFINIKVDREIRPDIDDVYMTATQLIRGGGGWPNNLLLTPDLKPFFAATTMMKPQVMQLTDKMSSDWQNRREQLRQKAEAVMQRIRQQLGGRNKLNASLPYQQLAGKVFSRLERGYDNRHGGFGTGQKFPDETRLLLLLDYAEREGSDKALDMVQTTVDHMLNGGIHDHVGGGFHRYTTDRQWHVPHFEKMLYNQGLMTSVLARLYARTEKSRYKRAIDRLVTFLDRHMRDDDGAFYSALNAETDAVEGAYYVWHDDKLRRILGQHYDVFMHYHSLEGLPHHAGQKNPDGKVLVRDQQLPRSTSKRRRIDSLLASLLDERGKRKRPSLDDKILTAWNGMMVMGLADAGRILDNQAYIRRAEKAAAFITDKARNDNGTLMRISIEGQAHRTAFLDDYAWLGRGLMALYRATGDNKYIAQARKLIKQADRRFRDESLGGYYFAGNDSQVPVRIKNGDDNGALPSANPVMAHLFADLHKATGSTKWRKRAQNVTQAFGHSMSKRPRRYSHMIYAHLRAGDQAQWQLVETAGKDKDRTGKDINKLAKGGMESRTKVDITPHLLAEQSTGKKKVVAIELAIDDDWHINANPASKDFLIPTSADVQTNTQSQIEVTYPEAKTMQTPLGTLDIYKGETTITATVTADEKIDEDKLRALVEVQACKDKTCLPPSQYALEVVN